MWLQYFNKKPGLRSREYAGLHVEVDAPYRFSVSVGYTG